LIAKREFGHSKQTKNAYILFEEGTSLESALSKNGELLDGKHLRVDRADGSSSHDYDSTVFVGNLPFIIEEEDVRRHFAAAGTIELVRIIRDPRTLMGKGIGYVKYSTKEEMNKAIETLSGTKLRYRELRVKRAAEPKRVEKKQKKRDEKAKERRREKKAL
jgi:nucleolar protein 12